MLALAMSIVLATPPIAKSDPPRAFGSLAELDSALAAVEKGGSAEVLWSRVLAGGPTPIVFGRTAVFFFRGEARSVEWRGDVVGWDASEATRGKRVGASDVWTWRRDLVPASRADYKVVVDGERWILDPLNPRTQLGGFGPNTELRMPGWAEAPSTHRRPGVAGGTLGDTWRIPSAALGYPIDVRVYTPAGFDPGAGRRYPVLYVNGNEYWDDAMGALVVTLDNLVADHRIPPLVAVFIDDWDRATNQKRDRKELVPAADGSCAFCDFVANELVTAVDTRFPTLASAEHRGLVSVSLGGLNAAATLARHPRTFGRVAFQSPYFGEDGTVLDALAKAPVHPSRAVVDVGVYERGFQDGARRLRAVLESKGASVRSIEALDGHSWGHWRATLAEAVAFLFPP